MYYMYFYPYPDLALYDQNSPGLHTFIYTYQDSRGQPMLADQ